MTRRRDLKVSTGKSTGQRMLGGTRFLLLDILLLMDRRAQRANAAAAQNGERCHRRVLPALLLGMSEAVGAGEREAHEVLSFHVQKKLLLAVLPKPG